MIREISNHIAWLFFPARFLFGKDLPRWLRVRGWENLRFVDKQEELRAVNRATGEVFLGGAGNGFLEVLLGPQSVFLLDHERHRQARQIVGNALSRRRLQQLTPVIDQIIDTALDKARKKRSVRLGPWSRRLTMTLMCKIVLGEENPATIDRLYQGFETTTGYLANLVTYWKRTWAPRGRFSMGGLVARLVRRIDDELMPLIEARRADGASGETPLDVLIREQEKHGYDDRFIRDNLVALLAAGYDTTGSAMTWQLYWIAQVKAFEQLRAHWAKGDTAYLEAFRNEALRFCPPLEILPRKVAKAQQGAAEEILPDLKSEGKASGAPLVCPSAHRVHHDPAVHRNPESFDPSRFLEGNRFGPDKFLPFGAGPRLCLGINLGRLLLEKVMERQLARGLDFQRRPTRFAPIRRNVSIWPGFLVSARLVAVK